MQKFRVYKGQELSFTITANSFDAVKEFMTSHGQDHSEFTIKTDLSLYDVRLLVEDLFSGFVPKHRIEDYGGSKYLRIDISTKLFTAYQLRQWEKVAQEHIGKAFVSVDMISQELVIKLTNNK